MSSQGNRSAAHSALLGDCEDYVRIRGGWTLRIIGGVGQRAGSPDIVACVRQHQTGEGAMVIIEAKTGRGQLTAAQQDERARWEAAGAVYVLARSLDDLEGALYDAGIIPERVLWPRRR